MANIFSVDSVTLNLKDYVNEGQKELEVKLEFDCEGGIDATFLPKLNAVFSEEEFDDILETLKPVVNLLWPGEKLYFKLNGCVK